MSAIGMEPDGRRVTQRHPGPAPIRIARRGWTPQFRRYSGEIIPDSIAEIHRLELGGLDQWVLIRGRSLANPPLIMLHGGPGMPETWFHRYFNAALEDHFTVVYWEQRGAGRSFDPRIRRSTMTVEQFISDLRDLVEGVRALTAQDRVVLFGHSWGAALGVQYAARFPDRVSAYVGCGQMADAVAGETASWQWAVAEATRVDNRRALKALRTIGPPPYDAKSLWTQRMWLNRLEGNLKPGTLWLMARAFFGSPESSIADLPGMMRGFRFSIDAMWDEVSRLDLFQRVPALEMPVFFFLGRNDHWVPPETSVAYLDALQAPAKKLVWFEQSGHEPFVAEADRFNTAMIELVRPITAAHQHRFG